MMENEKKSSLRQRLRGSDLLHNPILYALSIIVVLLTYYLVACRTKMNLDYVAINGTFQNYNFIRRFLNGQIPFVDFPVYLGSGHLITTSIVTFLCGGDYAASVLAYNFVSSLSLVFYCYSFGIVYFKGNWLVPSSLALVLRMVPSLISEYMLEGGNSARPIRGSIVPLVILIYVLVSLFFEKHENWSEKRQFYSHVVLFSILSGLAFVWGNDYGVASFIALFCLVLFFVIVKYKNVIRTIVSGLIMLSGSSLIILLFSFLITRGHPLAWFRSNFMSADFQGWYYENPLNHTLYYYQIDLTASVLICVVFLLAFFILLLKKIDWENIRRYGTGLFAMLACFGACQEYRLFSLREPLYKMVLLCTLIVFVIFFFVYIFSIFLKKKKIEINKGLSRIICCLWALIVIGFAVINILFLNTGNVYRKYYPELGGYLVTCSDDLDRSYELVAGRRIFSAYASALEVATDQYQPSGYDYIIHVLTDDARNQYLKSFNSRNFEVVSTVNVNYSLYGVWIRNANWFFYREVYSNWHYIGSNSYSDYWEYGAEPDSVYNDNIKMELYQESESEVYLIVVAEDKNINGVADVYVDYESDLKEGESGFLLHNIINGVCDQYTSDEQLRVWTLRQKNKEYIPVTIKDGVGYVSLVSYPSDITAIKINEASCDRIFISDFLPKIDE